MRNIRPALSVDEFDGAGNISADSGKRSIKDILDQLDGAAGYIGDFVTADLPVDDDDWTALDFTAAPSEKGLWAWDNTLDQPVYWNGAGGWINGSGGSVAAGSSGVARFFSIGPIAAKSTTAVHALYDNSSADFPGPFTNPVSPRNLTVTFSASWDGGDVTVTGTDQFDQPVSEVFADSIATVVGVKIFKTVTGATKETPAGVGGNGASIGTGDKIGVLADVTDANGFLWVGTTAEAVTIDATYSAFTPTTVPAATTYKLLANVA